MIKLITILAILLLASCRNPQDGDIIRSITPSTLDYDRYTCNSGKYQSMSAFLAPRGSFNIGDTIHFVKR